MGPVFKVAGAVLLCRDGVDGETAEGEVVPKCSLFFDPQVIEGMWEQDHPGIWRLRCQLSAFRTQRLDEPARLAQEHTRG